MNKVLKSLIEQAKAAAEHAYCPYSGFRVGAALLTSSGRVFSGCNVENSSYGLTICAERTALACAVAAGEKRFAMMVVYTPTERFTPPCGACRQVMAEFARNLRIVMVNQSGRMSRTTLRQLLPAAFRLDSRGAVTNG